MRALIVAVLAPVCLWLGACARHVPLAAVPAAQGTIRTIKFASGPDGTAREVLDLWKAKGIDFGPGKPYTRESAAQALAVVQQHYRANKIRKGQTLLEVQPAPPAGSLEVVFR